MSVKVLLIGGTSHVGKSTLAQRLAAKLNWNYLCTDQLARHPGRPWREDQTCLPPEVTEHFSTLTTTELVGSVVRHYRQNVWPIADAIVRSHVNNLYDPALVLEGSALLPELAVAARFDNASCIWLTAADDLISERIFEDSRFEEKADSQQRLITAFLARTLAFDETIVRTASQLGQRVLDAALPGTFDALLSACAPDSVP